MPSVSTTGSDNIAILDSKILASLCTGLFYVDITPSVFIGSGDENVLGVNVQILDAYGNELKPYGTNYEIAPGLSGGMAAQITFPIPTVGSNYIYQKYKINVKLYDADGASWVVTKTVEICAPNSKDKTKNYGPLSAQMKVDCKNGKLFVIIDSIPNYRGKLVESQAITGTLDYPTASGESPLSITNGSFAVRLYEGVYKLTGEICATYNFTDNVYVDVKYKIKKEHSARCLIDECCLFTALAELQIRTETDCTEEEKTLTANTILEALSLYKLIQLSANCGEDPSDYIDKLEALLGCKCTCNCNEGAPIINSEPSSNVVIEGCNVSKSTNGLTDTYTINNYEYKVSIAPNGGALVVTSGTLLDCVVTQQITFDISVVYSQIKTLADQNNTEADFWASVVNKSLRGIDPKCLGITTDAWEALTFKEKFELIIAKMCACCGAECEGSIENVNVTHQGADVLLTWEGVAYLFEVYLDGVLVGSYLASAAVADVFSHTFAGAADGNDHTWVIIARDASKNACDEETGTFGYEGCPAIAAPVIDSPINDTCPYDLTGLVAPAGLTREWHTANSTSAGTLVNNPAAAEGGLYYAFDKDENGCYSPGTPVTIICDSELSCTAPQNLDIYKLINTPQITFQSAAYPPPGNSYTVYRRLASDPDTGGSYTNIGDAVWDTSINKWRVSDFTAATNTLYVYKAVSNCGSTEPNVQKAYANIVCPPVTTYQTDTTIAYSFVPLSGASKIEVELYNSTGVSLIHIDTYTPVIANPRTGLFEYLSANTTYKLRLKITFGSGDDVVVQNCSFYTITTDESA